MAQTKTEAMKLVSNQQALVNIMMETTVKPIRRTIPGGRHLLDQIDSAKLREAVFTWLRGTRWFDEVTIGLSNTPNGRGLKERKIMDFPDTGKWPVWDVPQRGKLWLAEKISDYLGKTKLISIRASKEGLYAILPAEKDSDFGPGAEDWEPYIEFLPRRTEQYK